MQTIKIGRNESLFSVMKKMNIVDNYNEYWSLIYNYHVFLDCERVYHHDIVVDFVQKSMKDRLYDINKDKFIMKHYVMLRIGGSLNPDNEEHGRKIMLERDTARDGILEKFI